MFQVSNFADRRQLSMYGLALLLTFLPTELGVTQRILGLVPLDGNQWLLCIGFAVALTLVYEIMKFFLRRSRRGGQTQPAPAVAAQSQAA